MIKVTWVIVTAVTDFILLLHCTITLSPIITRNMLLSRKLRCKHKNPNTFDNKTWPLRHYCDVIIISIASQITSLTIVCSSVYSGVDQRKHQSSASLAFMWGIHRWSVTRKMFPFDDVIMVILVVSGVTAQNRTHRFHILHWGTRDKFGS